MMSHKLVPSCEGLVADALVARGWLVAFDMSALFFMALQATRVGIILAAASRQTTMALAKLSVGSEAVCAELLATNHTPLVLRWGQMEVELERRRTGYRIWRVGRKKWRTGRNCRGGRARRLRFHTRTKAIWRRRSQFRTRSSQGHLLRQGNARGDWGTES